MRVHAILREPLDDPGGRQPPASSDQQIARMLDEVGLPMNALERYPHEFSGGQRQRIALARALMLEPKVIVADEPVVSALDVSIRSQVLNLMKRLQAEHGMASIVISHDLAVVKYLADRIGVMYLGKLVELGNGRRHLPARRAPLHRRADQDDPAARPGGREREDRHRDPRRAAEPDQPAQRAAGSAPAARGRSAVRRGGAAAARVRPRPPGGLPLPAADADGGERCWSATSVRRAVLNGPKQIHARCAR